MTPSSAGSRVAFALRDTLAWDEVVEIVQTAERTGYEAIFLPEIAGRETFSTLAALSPRTRILGLGTGVVTSVSRRVSVTAMAAATVHDVSGGRMILGVGTGPAGPGALERLRGYVAGLRDAFAGRAVAEERRGEPFRLTLPVAGHLPVWIAALGPRAMRLAGRVADGVILNWCSPERVAFARERIAEGAAEAGRDPSGVTVAVLVRAARGRAPEGAAAALGAAAAQYAAYPAYAAQFDAMGLGSEAAAAAEAGRKGRPLDVPERLLGGVCLAGGAGDAARRLQAYRDAGADLPVVYPVAVLDPLSSILGTLFALAPRPAVEA